MLLKPLAIDLFLIGPVALVELRISELRERSSGNGQKDAEQDAYNESSHDTPPCVLWLGSLARPHAESVTRSDYTPCTAPGARSPG